MVGETEQVELAITFAPLKVRRYGLRDAHSRPLVSLGKDKNGKVTSFRVSPSEAWDYPSLELRAANSWPCFILDLDGREATKRFWELVILGEIAEPSWVVMRKSSGGMHVVWCLVNPVHRGASARESPLKLFNRISEFYAEATGADDAYCHVLTHNPMSRGHGPGFITAWQRQEPYGLKELAVVIPQRWRVPSVPRTTIGYNCRLFNAGMKWAGSRLNLGSPVLPRLVMINRSSDKILPFNEVQGVAKSVERYRDRWIGQGRFYSEAEAVEWGRLRGVQSGKVRRALVIERDLKLVKAVQNGCSMAAIARELGISRRLAGYIVLRDAPLWARRGIGKPWESEGR